MPIQAEVTMAEEEGRWKAESDARALAQADAIRSDPDRVNRATKAANRLVDQMEERAEEQTEEAKAMRKIAKGRFFNYDKTDR